MVTNNNHNKVYTFVDNGEFTFTYKDEAGNTGAIVAKVDWITKKVELPIIRLHYSEEKKTKGPVSVMLINQGGPIEILNNGGNNIYTFTKNGEFTFEYKDVTGNIRFITAKVDWIIEEQNNGNNSNNGNMNQNNSSSNWSSNTQTSKPQTNTSIDNDNVNSDTNDSIINKNDNNSNNNANNNKEQNDNQNENKNQEEKQELKEEKNHKVTFGIIGFICIFIIVLFIKKKLSKNR